MHFRQPLNMLTYNIQTGISTYRYRHYFTKSWQYILPASQKFDNLNKIAEIIRNYDVVALQEIDMGSFRSAFINQVEYLAEKSGFPFWHAQCTRNLGIFAQHGNGLLSKFPFCEIHMHKLPGVGRGLLLTELGTSQEKLLMVVLHFSLGPIAQQQQIAYLEKLIAGHPHVVIMGDMNCPAESGLLRPLIERAQLFPASQGIKTFPSWSPIRDLDHIFVSPSLEVKEVLLPHKLHSDHLPIGVSLRLPSSIRLSP